VLTTNFALLTVRNAMDFHYRKDMANISVTSGMIKDNPFLPQAGHPLLGYWEGFTIFFKCVTDFVYLSFIVHREITIWLLQKCCILFGNLFFSVACLFHVIGPNYAEEFCKRFTSNIIFMYILSCFVHLISCSRYIIMKMIDGRIFLTETR